MYRAHHTVVDSHLTTGQTDNVDSVALHVVVIVVFLRSRNLHGIFAVNTEYRITKDVLGLQRVSLALRPVLLLDAIGQRQLRLVTTDVLETVIVVTEVVERIEILLLVVDEHRRVVDAVILGVVGDDSLVHLCLLSILP